MIELTSWRSIPLTKGQMAMVDVSDLDRISALSWHAAGPVKSTGKYYATSKFRPVKGGPQRTILLSRFLMCAEKGQEVDHRSGDTLDNRRTNLRLTDRRGNQNNRRDHSPWGPGIDMGGSWRPFRDQRPFRARVFVDGKLRYVGCFATAAEARAARRQYLEDATRP